ncbi:MAG: tRNA dihydrouridine synthase DusB [Treponema sp.]|nr:tRNA dihydrouridine synthase DusB [Treponema sp.]
MKLYRPVTVGSLSLEGNLFLAPVAGYTERAFRSLCVEQGANFSFTELVSADALYRNPGHYGLAGDAASGMRVSAVAKNLVRRAVNERHYAVQLFGSDPDVIYQAALQLAPLQPDAVDINAGCPVPKVVKNGAGSALMKDPPRLGRIVEAAGKASREALGDVPVTIKIRSGWDSGSVNYAECARIAVESGAAMVSLHPRTRSQNYGGTSDWSCIADLVSRLPVPVTGSGDLYTPEDAERMLRETGCAAVMFARGVMGNPFIFSSARSFLETGAWEPVPFSERLAAAFRHLELLAADIGERTACLEMRKQFCAYTKGIPGGAAIRAQAVRAQTIEDYRGLLIHYNLGSWG